MREIKKYMQQLWIFAPDRAQKMLAAIDKQLKEHIESAKVFNLSDEYMRNMNTFKARLQNEFSQKALQQS